MMNFKKIITLGFALGLSISCDTYGMSPKVSLLQQIAPGYYALVPVPALPQGVIPVNVTFSASGAPVIERPEAQKYVNKKFMCAVRRGQKDLFMGYLREGADINAQDDLGRTSLMLTTLLPGTLVDSVHFAGRQRCAAEMVCMLLGHGARLDIRNNKRETVLMLAALQGHVEIVRMLLERAPLDVINATEDNGSTALMLAVLQGHTKIVRMLLESGANGRATDHKGRTAFMIGRLQLFRDEKYQKVERVLILYGARSNDALFWGIFKDFQEAIDLIQGSSHTFTKEQLQELRIKLIELTGEEFDDEKICGFLNTLRA